MKYSKQSKSGINAKPTKGVRPPKKDSQKSKSCSTRKR